MRGHYVYWLVMPMPTAATVARTGVKTPRDFDRTSFRDVCIEAHTFNGIDMAETVCFLEPHANGDPHLNLLGDLFLHSFRAPPPAACGHPVLLFLRRRPRSNQPHPQPHAGAALLDHLPPPPLRPSAIRTAASCDGLRSARGSDRPPSFAAPRASARPTKRGPLLRDNPSLLSHPDPETTTVLQCERPRSTSGSQ